MDCGGQLMRSFSGRRTWLFANTRIGMRAWFAAAESWGIGEALLGALSETEILARGPKASAAVYQAGLHVSGRATSTWSTRCRRRVSG